MVQERLWTEHHPPHHHSARTDLVCSMSPENGFGKDLDSAGSSDSEDLHYGPGIVNRLRNKYLSLALRESNARPTILRKATSLENLLDDDGDRESEKEELFTRRSGGNEGSNRYRSATRRQEMKRARSVEVISRTNHYDEELSMTSVTTKINNRQSLHEDMLNVKNEEMAVLIEDARPYKKSVAIENNIEETDKYSRRINRPKRIPPLLNEREKPPVDVVKHAKMIFEKRPETRTKKPHHTGEVAAKVNSFNSMIVKTKLAAKPPWKSVKLVKPLPNGDVAAKVDSFNDIIVKTKVALKSTKPTIKSTKPVLNDRCKSNTHHVRPVAKPVILSEEMLKPKTLNLSSPRQEKKGFNSLPSPIPDVSRVDIKSADGSDSRSSNLLCETPDLILTSSPLPKITSPTYRRRSTENFIKEERKRSAQNHPEATNTHIISPVHSPSKPTSLVFNRDESDTFGIKMISPISQSNITKSSATSVYNFMNAQVDQRHLPSTVKQNRSPISEPPKSEYNGFGTSKIKMGLSAFEMEKNLKNSAKSGIENGAQELVEDSVEHRSESLENISDLEPSRSRSADNSRVQGDVVEFEKTDNHKSKHNLGKSVGKTSSIFENLGKSNKTAPSWFEPSYKLNKTPNISSGTDSSQNYTEESEQVETTDKPKQEVESLDVVGSGNLPDTRMKKSDEEVSKTKVDLVKLSETVKSVQSASNKNSAVTSEISDNKPIKIVLPKKPKPRKEEATSAVFNFTTRKDVPDYISNDTSRTASRPVIPKPDEPGIKLLPDALLTGFQDVWEEDELIRSLEARPPSPCDVTFINDNILIDGKSSLIQITSKRTKLKISFVDDADIYEYPSETSLLLDEAQISTLAGTAQVGHTIPTLSGSSLATYTPKTTETFQLGVTKSFQETSTAPKVGVQVNQEVSQADVLLEETVEPVLFSSGSTSDILF
ncbi:uncharacterized protein LOC125502301 isoform X2 [Dendroctonus ponderosae]|uniref:uncharacterized protein LOC109543143 isoform X2 n=1 Tax=Dendroctonus ponderosae TaxID=77166 RepID=UPI002035F719|nr:uncharacterized protein LOC109543143 isoform X2 [Dendroctonus ponderosae]XP_048521393.1 uncharacterized protein LOC125504082 isoform X2 [Dendroctonus ponderosae]XP_048521399.1 uncharacterized protein LOC125502301 isoform X2 [Dendroctonus ponderosae]KAH1013071.1 hypothetical protein HUJ05_012120 [Dendroctonus ponderosae]